ncbi:protein sevenless isoform X2 [Drosophila obscura]|uniref:protein sevenless isoform X2 n=1 Tax=Drosophila obscura TaxID=7282 RepID=UPI001BB1604D|nr:protein sevenless isoform X2 [Drosophila obscura]
MNMFWHQNVDQAQQQQQQQQQSQSQSQQKTPGEATAKRFNISFNVKIAVNVNTKMSTNHINQQSSPTATTCQRKHSVQHQSSRFDLREQVTRLGRQLASGQDGHGGISAILIVNLLLLILLSICCDGCRSQDGRHFNYSGLPQKFKDHLSLLPKLDSDVVEKVAIWHKHAAADPPSIVEGIAISSISRPVPEPAPAPAPMAELPEDGIDGIDERVVLERVTRECVQRCIVEEDLFLDEFGIKCEKADSSEKCYKTRCTKGCAQWYRALKEVETCQEACSSPHFYSHDMPCIGACEMSQRNYWLLQRLAMTQTVQRTQPQLVQTPSQDRQDTPLTIKWAMHFPEHYLSSRPFNIQYQYADLHNEQNDEKGQKKEGTWINLADYDCDEYYVCEILEPLTPYTQYRFRFELPFGESNDDVLYSPATPAYQTPPEGAPISAPVIEELLPLDESHVAVHWHPGSFTNGPVEGYRLRLSSSVDNRTIEQLVAVQRGNFIFSQLQAHTKYRLELTMVNKHGESPASSASVVTSPARVPQLHKDQGEAHAPSVLVAGQRNIVWQSLTPGGETRLVLHSDQPIGDMAWEQKEQRLWVVDVLGEMRSLRLEQGQPTSGISRVELDGRRNISGEWIPRKLSLDWLHRRLYLAVETPSLKFSLLKVDLESTDFDVLSEALDPVQQMEVDPLNGWLFWTDAESVWRLDLASKERIRIARIRQPGWFTLDPLHWLLHLLVAQEGKILEFSYDGSFKVPLIALPDNSSQAFALQGRSLLLAGASQIQLLLADQLNHGGLGTWPLRHFPDCWGLILLTAERFPSAHPSGVPRRLSAVLGAQAAHISWQEPSRNHYQSPVAALDLTYELEVLDVASQSAFSIRNIRSPHFGLERLQPDNLYHFRVRAMRSAGEPGDWTPPHVARTWPLGPHRLRWATYQGALYETNELGGQLERMEAQLEARPGPLAMINASAGYYVAGSGVLHCINVEQPQLRCLVPDEVPHVGAVTYDWRGGRVYWSDLARNCVVRLDPWSGTRELLPIFGARQLAIDPRQGHLYYATANRLASRPLSSSPGHPQHVNEEEVEFYHVNGLGDSIASFSLDLEQGQLHWLVSGPAALRLYRASLGVVSVADSPRLVQSWPGRDALPQSLQVVRPLGALLWLDRGGRRALLARTTALDDTMELWPLGLNSPASSLQLADPTAPPPPDAGVIPSAVLPDSVRLDDGHWDDFHVRWQPATSGGNHSISYRLLIEYGQRLQTLDLATPFARITHLPQAQLQLTVSITARTAWRTGPTTRVQLCTPAAAPTQPRRLRVFVERIAKPLVPPSIGALLRWDAPEQAPAPVQALEYRISCWLGSEIHAELLLNQSTLEARVENLQRDQTYRFQVEAHVASTGAAAGAASHALHVTPEVQAVPRFVFANTEFIGELDLDSQLRRRLVHTASPVEHLAIMEGEQRLLWVNEHVELLTHVPGSTPAKLARMRAEVLALTVDWVQRIVYWAELEAGQEAPSAQVAVIYRLDLCRFEGRILQGERLWSTPRGHLLRDLVALPHSRALVWLEHEAVSRNSTLRGRRLTDGSPVPLESPTALFRLYEGSLEPGTETLNLVDHQGRLCVYDVARQLCTVTGLRSQLHLLTRDSGQLAQDAGYLYALRNGSIRAYGRRRHQLEYLVELEPEEVRLLQAHNYQAYPSKRCLLLPAAAALDSTAVQCEELQCTLALTQLHASPDCALPVPGLSYQLNLTSLEGGQREGERHQWLAGSGDTINITGLQPFSRYQLRATLSSYYQLRLGLDALPLPTMEVRTAQASPTAPRNFSARVLGPSEVVVSWAPPLQLRSESVHYTIHWRQNSNGNRTKQEQDLEQDQDQDQEQMERRVETAGMHRLRGLRPGSGYRLWVQAHATPTKFNSSSLLHVRTYVRLPELQLLELGPYSLTLSWAGTSDPLSYLALECRSAAEQLRWEVAGNHSWMVVEPLKPRTRYECQLLLVFASSPGASVYRGPTQEYETLGDAPSAPGRPQLQHISGEIFRVHWSAARGNGDPIALYSLEALQARARSRSRSSRRRRRESVRGGRLALLPWAEEPAVVEDQWLDFCNTTELSCIVRSLHSSRLLLFRVRARSHEHGWGPYSEDSDRVSEPLVSPEKRGSLVLAIIAPAAIVSSCVLALFLVRKVQKRRMRAKKLLQQSRPSIWSNLSTLSTQQQLLAARSRAFSTTLSDADIALLPHIRRSQLTLRRFLGSGAFGEVYEGDLQPEDKKETQRVAIKSLRKGASEFAELLQEAQLMSNFKHENIVCLVGICFDTESISLVMEHMEAGDLLSYLRAARPNSQEVVQGLSLSELLAMCIDVANGCSYLEDMHFVHRDLACRNCLVSEGTEAGHRRMVKIGDFGLARDIYKSDYYRKEGEGLLPVRWMAPESLVDGVFTTQSDVWAFGVLCWEILTLGQQPYAARNNFEVLAHVKDGGRLHQPTICPDKMHSLLLLCWRTDPSERPSFRRCFNALHAISTDLRRIQLPPVHSRTAGSSGEAASPTRSQLKVRFDEHKEKATGQESEKEKVTKEPEIMSLRSVSCQSPSQQLYANEGISRL